MRKTLLKTLLLVLSVQLAHAQQDTNEKKKKVQISDVYVMPGMVTQSAYATLSEVVSMAPSSAFPEDLSGFNQAYWGRSRTNNRNLLLNLGINLSDPERNDQRFYTQLRIGFAYTSGRNIGTNFYKEERHPYDTLTSGQTGQTYYIDSIYQENYSINNRHERIGLDLSLIFRTKNNTRWSAYGGFGVSGAYTFNNYFTSYKYDSFRTAFQATNHSLPSYLSSPYGGQSSDNLSKGVNYLIYSAYVPLGVDFQLSKQNEFWKRMHLIYELRPGVNISMLTNTTSFMPYLQQNLGIRVSLL